MIIRNPYSFVVKHYKLINFLLLIPMIFLVFKFGNIANFFKDYISNGYVTKETNFVDSYITGLTTLAISFMIIANIILYLIFTSKKKNGLFYTINIVYFIILLVGLLLFSSSMNSIEKDSLDATFANFVRDVSLICYLPMYLLMIVNVSKAFGFNFKTLQFDNNSELKIREEDDEDIELKIGSDNNTIKKNIVSVIRELKYYVLENKFVFTCIGVVLLILFVFISYQNYKLYNKTYKVNQAFDLDNFSLALKDSYITDVDYRGMIVTEDKYYLAIRMAILNNGQDAAIPNTQFRIYIGDDIIYPSYDKSSRFIDIGEAYQGEIIRKAEEDEQARDYVFVYELTKEQVKSSYQMRILSSINEKNGKVIPTYRRITVKPRNVTKTNDLGVVKLGEEVKLKDTTLGNTTFTINELTLDTSYRYTYEMCNLRNICSEYTDTVVPSTGKILLIIKDEINVDPAVPYYQYQYQDFYIDYSSLIYQFTVNSGKDEGNKIRTTTLTNVTPKVLKDVKIYEVPNTMYNASKINFEIRVRNNYLTMVVRD